MTTLTEAARAEAIRLAHVALDESEGLPIVCDWMSAALKVCRYVAALAASEVQAEPVGHVRIDSGEVHIVPKVRDAEFSALRDGQSVYAHPPAPEQPAPALASAPRVPQGWKLVPVEPTEAMVDATHHGQPVSDIYRDMLAAAPQPEGDTP
jgi:hypothetical protein